MSELGAEAGIDQSKVAGASWAGTASRCHLSMKWKCLLLSCCRWGGRRPPQLARPTAARRSRAVAGTSPCSTKARSEGGTSVLCSHSCRHRAGASRGVWRVDHAAQWHVAREMQCAAMQRMQSHLPAASLADSNRSKLASSNPCVCLRYPARPLPTTTSAPRVSAPAAQRPPPSPPAGARR